MAESRILGVQNRCFCFMDNNNPSITALIVAAGSGTRFGVGGVPKQYVPLLGKPLLRWSIDAFVRHPAITNIAVVIHPDHQMLFETATAGMDIQAIHGGTTRQQSVRLGLEACAHKNKTDFVLIHDAARPCLSADMISAICGALINGAIAVMPALPVTDTIRRLDDADRFSTEDRSGLFTVQTPQAFAFDLIHDLHQKMQDQALTDDIALVEKSGGKIDMIAGDSKNIKVTYADSLALAAQYLAESRTDIRTGKGYDVHRLVPPRDADHKLIIGGIVIPHEKSLEGHSDADVGLHAITDALLGTIGDGDIGMHFSPKDARWKNADSAAFLKHAAGLITAQNGIITHVDLTVICETPKIGPHREAMRTRIAEILNLAPARVSIKATTTEGLGFTGRGEGIAAEAIATVRLPFTAETVTTSTQNRQEAA